MSLLNKANNTPAFEAEGADTKATAKVDTAQKPAADKPTTQADKPVDTAPASDSTAVTEHQETKVAISAVPVNPLTELKDTMRVDYNTLPQIIANNGNFVDRETKTVLGDVVTFELISYQDSWVVSPEDDKAPKEVVKYSNDGKVTTDGIPVQEALDEMHNTGYPNARLKKRAVVVAGIQGASKTDKYNGVPVQFDLSPKSETQWKRFLFTVAYGLRIKTLKPEQVNQVKATAEMRTNPDNKSYTEAQFAVNV